MNKVTKTSKAIKVTKSSKLTNSDFITFWRPTDQNGIYGQWWISNFVLSDDAYKDLPKGIKCLLLFSDHPEVVAGLMRVHVNCAEQFMMLGKALLFGDLEIAELIKQEMDPKRHKALGRRVRNFNPIVWEKYRNDIVILGNYLKFTQNLDLKHALSESGTSELVEGSPLDKIWGVGLKFDDPLIYNKSNWKGKNKLGVCLMKIREIIYESI